jgi:AcrR family transcriptional regulator
VTHPHSTRSTRRRPAEVRQLLLDAASELFAADDYASTSTISIAERAGVAESALFRHFGSKPGLLAAAVVQPFQHFVDSFSTTWQELGSHPKPENYEKVVRAFVTDLYDNVVARRGLIRTLIGASKAPDAAPVITEVHQRLEKVFAVLEQIASASAHERQLNADQQSTQLKVRAIVAMIMSIAALDDWFLPERRPGRGAIIDQLTRLILFGLEPGQQP